jgi:hypothetical protein
MVGDRPDVNIDHALSEFYAKAVVGLLARTNLHLIKGNPNRQKIFKTIVRSLHEGFALRFADEQVTLESLGA